jgi:uncharacterized membrane protein
MRHFAFRSSLTIRGRAFRGLRGYAGKPFHPPLTDVPVTAYLFAAVFDVTSAALAGTSHPVQRELYLAGSWTLLGGVAVSLLTALTGWADWHRSSQPGTQARRTVNAHAATMITVTAIVVTDVLVRYLGYPDATATPVGIAILSACAAALVCFGATIGGTLVFDYGFNVETAGDYPVWHESEVDVLPGGRIATPATSIDLTPATAERPV